MQLSELVRTENRNEQTVLMPNMPWSLYKVTIERNTREIEAVAFWEKAMTNSTGDNFFRAVDPDIPPWEKGTITWNW